MTEKDKKDKEISDEEMELMLDKITPTQEEFIDRRINHIPFAKIIFWLNFKSKKAEFVYATELANFMKFSQARAYNVLRDLCKANLLKRNPINSSVVEFHFVKNGEKPIINKYLGRAKVTLDLK